jgi:hypothetical protein
MKNLINMKNSLSFMKLLAPNPFTFRNFFSQKNFLCEKKFVETKLVQKKHVEKKLVESKLVVTKLVETKSSAGVGSFMTMKQSFILVLLAVFIFVSCKDKPDQVAPAAQTAAEDSVSNENIDTVLSDETIALFNQSGFSTFAKSKSPAFDWGKFRMMNSWKEDSLYITPFEPASNYYETYKPYLKYSPDGSMFIDLDSYNLALEKDKNGQQVAIESGPDTEVSLVNIKDKKKTRLVFLGPGSSIEDGSWIDNENLVLFGFQETGDTGNKLPIIWRFHLPTTTFYIYEMPDPAVAKQLMGQWRKERLKGLTIK